MNRLSNLRTAALGSIVPILVFVAVPASVGAVAKDIPASGFCTRLGSEASKIATDLDGRKE